MKWSSGQDKGKYTPGVPIEWLRDFEKSEWVQLKQKGEAESYLCEWREGKNEPAGGWPVYDAEVIEVSSKYFV